MRILTIPMLLASTVAFTGCADYGYGGYGNRDYGYGNRGYGNQNFERAAADACTYQARRYGPASITNVERRGGRSVRVQGVIDANSAYNSRGYGRSGNYGRAYVRRTFACTFRDDGRITGFKLSRPRRY